jgi:hypothetical protein
MPVELQAPDLQSSARALGWWDAAGIQLLVVALALMLQLALTAQGVHLAVPPPPWNWIVTGVGTSAAIALGAVCRRQRWLLWLSGAQYAISIIAVVAAIAFLGALIPQDTEKTDQLARLGLRDLYNSLPFLAAALLMLLNLSLALGRRLLTPRPGYIAFVLNHLGMALVIIGMIAGQSQFAKPNIQIKEGEQVTTASIKGGPTYHLGATVGLTKFEIEKYPPKLAAQEMATGGRFASDSDWVSQGRQFAALGLHVSVLEYLPTAMPDDQGGWAKSDSHGLPAARIAVTGPEGLTAEGWVAPALSTMGIQSQPLGVGDKYVVGLLEQQPKAYRSYLTITEPGQAERTATLEVNHPVRVGDWQLYQLDYTVNMAGRSSIIQAVRDPALPVVYTGLACMVLGAFLALWFASGRRAPDTTPTGSEEA